MTDTPVAAETPPAISPSAAPAAAEVSTPAAAPIADAAPIAAAPEAPSAPAAPAEVAQPESTSSLLSSADGKPAETPKDAPKEQPAPAAADAKDPPKEAEAKPAEATDPAKTADALQPPAQVKYEELKVPDGLDEGRIKSWLEVINDPKLSAVERASKSLEAYETAAKELGEQAAANQRKVWTEYNDGLKAELRKDPEIGGAKMDRSLSMALSVVKEILPPESAQKFLAFADYSGMGNHPEVIRFLNKIGEKLNIFEDGITPAGAKPPNPPKGPGNRGWYPTMGGTAA